MDPVSPRKRSSPAGPTRHEDGEARRGGRAGGSAHIIHESDSLIREITPEDLELLLS